MTLGEASTRGTRNFHSERCAWGPPSTPTAPHCSPLYRSSTMMQLSPLKARSDAHTDVLLLPLLMVSIPTPSVNASNRGQHYHQFCEEEGKADCVNSSEALCPHSLSTLFCWLPRNGADGGDNTHELVESTVYVTRRYGSSNHPVNTSNDVNPCECATLRTLPRSLPLHSSKLSSHAAPQPSAVRFTQ